MALGFCLVLVLNPALARASQTGNLLASAQEEPGGFRLDEAETPPKRSPGPPDPAGYRPATPTSLPPPTPPPRAAKDPLPGYLSLGLGVAFGLVGAIFAANTVAAVGDFPSLRRGQVVNATFETQLEDAQTAVLLNGLVTSILFSASVSSLVAGTLYLVSD